MTLAPDFETFLFYMAYVYLHKLKENESPFYIGISSNNQNNYNRAFSKKRRSKFWYNKVKNNNYIIEIVKENISWGEACEIEKYLIFYFGRLCTKTGTLVNLNLGGEGNFGYKHTKEALIKIKNNRGNKNIKECIHFETNQKFNSLKDGCIHFNLDIKIQRNAINRKYSTAQFYYKNNFFERKTKEEKINNYKKAKQNYNPNTFKKIKVKHIETNKIFESLIEGCKYFNYVYDTEHNRLFNNKINKKFNYTREHEELDKIKTKENEK